MSSRAPVDGARPSWAAILKTAAVMAGYAAAFAMASVAVYIRQLNTQGPDAQASAGMYAAGDAMLFVAVFGSIGLLPTALGLYFLRPVRAFWTVLAIGVVAFAATGPFTVTAMILASSVDGLPSFWTAWAGLGVLRVLPAPLFAMAFLLGGCLTPGRILRWALMAAAIIEGGVAAYGLLHWFILPNLGAL